MSRDLPTGAGAAFAAQVVAPIFLVELQWPSGTVRAWSGFGNIVWDGDTYVGTGTLGTISEVRESREGAANGMVLTLAGVNSAELAHALEDDSQGQPGRVWLGTLAADGTLSHDPYLIFDGIIDVCPTEDSGETATISVHLEKELIDTRTRGRRYTHEDHQLDAAGDLFFEFVAGLAEKDVQWGNANAPAGGVVPGSGGGTNYGTEEP